MKRRSLLFIAFTLCIGGLTLLIDAFTPLGYAVGAAYALIHALGVHVTVRRADADHMTLLHAALWLPAAFYSGLIVAGYFLSPQLEGAIDPAIAVTNCALFICILWLLSAAGMYSLYGRLRLKRIVENHARELELYDEELGRRLSQIGYSTVMVETEIRQPVQSVLANSRFLYSEMGPETAQSARVYAENLIHAAERAARALDNLIARLKRDDRDVEHSDVWLENALDRAMASHRSELVRRRTRVSITGFARSFRTDGRLLQRTLDALIESSVKSLRSAERPELEVEYRRNASLAEISVRHNGRLASDVSRFVAVGLEQRGRANREGGMRKWGEIADCVQRLGGQLVAAPLPEGGEEIILTLATGE